MMTTTTMMMMMIMMMILIMMFYLKELGQRAEVHAAILRRAVHRKRLARARLAVRENAHVVPAGASAHERRLGFNRRVKVKSYHC
jgi:hypothetical protein